MYILYTLDLSHLPMHSYYMMSFLDFNAVRKADLNFFWSYNLFHTEKNVEILGILG